MPEYGHLDSAPHQAPLSHGDRESESRLARQKQQQREMNQRVLAYILCLATLVIAVLAIGWD